MKKIDELRFGPVRTERDKWIALEELERKINAIIRSLNEIMERLDYVDADI